MNMLISNILLFFSLTFFANATLKRKGFNYITVSFMFVIGVLLSTFKNYPSDYLNGTFLMILFYAVFIFSLYESSFYKRILVLLLFVLSISLSEIFVANIMHQLFNLTADHIHSNLYTVALLISNLIAFLILCLLIKFMRIDILTKYTKFMWLSLILPVVTLLLLFNFTDYFNTFRDNMLSLFIILGLIIANIISILAVINDYKRLELSDEIKKSKMKYEILNNQYNTNFYFLHDTIRELTKLSTLINKENYLDLQKNIINLNRNLMRSFNAISTNYVLLNTLINYRISTINKYNINIKTVIECNDFSFISPEDEQLLFTILLNISIESCVNTNLDCPWIIIKTKKIKNQYIIQISFSNKDNNKLDLSRLYQCTSKYHGHISEAKYQEKDFAWIDIFIVFFNI